MPTRIGLEGPWPYGHLNCSNQKILTPGRVPRQISKSPAFSDTCPQFGLDSGFLLRGCLSSGYLYVGTGETAYAHCTLCTVFSDPTSVSKIASTCRRYA